jgi:2-C-methyl-D-erythritol 4-phosphate cytidylyltransferase/2-C-methyl-D-erythritol 2,4-cyclodiphosphate synthase
MSTFALVLAAGSGSRFGGDVPKQFVDLAGKPVVRWAVEALGRSNAIAGIRAVIRRQDLERYLEATRGLDQLPPVYGGATRQESARIGLESLIDEAPTRIIIHDGARPFPPAAVTDRLLAALDHTAGAIAAVALRDTVKRVDGGRVVGGIERANLWRAQTPQAFRFADILAAHRALKDRSDLTDDASVLEAVGGGVTVVVGEEINIKVTDEHDLSLARRLVAGGTETRVGTGFDVHRLGPGTGLAVCGVHIAGDRALIGHSDADVGLHAVVDALLGTIGAGDIGVHFPPTDPRWRGEPSRTFVAHAAGLVRAAGGAIVNVDLTLICERPKVAPHRARMIRALAEMLGIEPSRVSVKATTTEGLGFAGRGEGIAAQAAVAVRLGEAP